MRSSLDKLRWVLSTQFGIDPLLLWRALLRLPTYARDFRCFRTKYTGTMTWRPCLHDRFDEAGTTKSEYFWQDLIVARWIYEASPRKHVDVGSRVDGFVAHVASFRELEVLDIRPITTAIPGVLFRQVDVMTPEVVRSLAGDGGYCDSLSCLHAIEHFGLGRYGDTIDARGYERALTHLASLLEPQGTLYLSTPLGRERVEFNAHRVFAPQTILDFTALNGLTLQRFLVFCPNDGMQEIRLESLAAMLPSLANDSYRLGIMQFVKSDESGTSVRNLGK